MMKSSKFLAFLLVCVILASVFCTVASAESTINFIPELKGGRIYGTALKTPQSALRALYKKQNVLIYDNDGNLVTEDSDAIIGTGYTLKLNGKLFYSAVVMGDIDGDGELSQMDYILIKRAFLGTFTVSSLAKEAAGMEPGGELRAINYIMVKRAYFGTYDINKKYTCEPYDPDQGNDGWSQGWV